MRYRLLALDLDGTALDPYGALTDGVKRAVDAALEREIRVVLCTGRRYRTALPLANELGLTGPIVVNNGVLVKDIESGRTEEHRYLPSDVQPEVLSIIRDAGAPLLYVDDGGDGVDIYTEREESAHPYQREYLAEAAVDNCRFVGDVGTVERRDVIMISTMGDPETLGALHERTRQVLGERVKNHSIANKNFQGKILEFLAPGVSKWQALERLASAEGIRRHEIAAVGDDTNDVEMIRGAGLGIAMGNAVRAAKSASDLVVRSNAEGGVIEAIERVILKS